MVRWELVVAQVSGASKASTLASGGEWCRVFWALLPVSSQPVFQDSGVGRGWVTSSTALGSWEHLVLMKIVSSSALRLLSDLRKVCWLFFPNWPDPSRDSPFQIFSNVSHVHQSFVCFSFVVFCFGVEMEEKAAFHM